jgi:hypothetical protein
MASPFLSTDPSTASSAWVLCGGTSASSSASASWLALVEPRGILAVLGRGHWRPPVNSVRSLSVS